MWRQLEAPFLQNGQEKLPVQRLGPEHPRFAAGQCLPVKSSRQWWACPSHWKLRPHEQLPQLLWGQHLWGVREPGLLRGPGMGSQATIGP